MQSALEWQQDRYRTARERINAAGVEFQRKQQAKREREQRAKLPRVASQKEVDAVARWFNAHENRKSNPERIIKEVADKHGVTVLDIKSRRREKFIIPARQEACWRLRTETILSLPEIGQRMNRDPTGIMYSVKKHEKRMEASR